MRFLLLPAVGTILALLLTSAHGRTMYKCADAKGKIAFSDQPCAASAKVVKTFDTTAPRQNEEEAARVAQDTAKWQKANEGFKERQASRDKAYVPSGGGSATSSRKVAGYGQSRLEAPNEYKSDRDQVINAVNCRRGNPKFSCH